MNESKAFHAFDEDPTTEWVSDSLTYDHETGDYRGKPTADSYYEFTVLPANSKLESLTMPMELGHSNSWTIEWEHEDTANASNCEIFVGNGNTGRFYIKVVSGKYRVALDPSTDLESDNTTDYVANQRNKVLLSYHVNSCHI